MHTWHFSPKRVLVLCFGGFILGIEAVLVAISFDEKTFTEILLSNGLVSLAVLFALGNVFLSARKPAAEPQSTEI